MAGWLRIGPFLLSWFVWQAKLISTTSAQVSRGVNTETELT